MLLLALTLFLKAAIWNIDSQAYLGRFSSGITQRTINLIVCTERSGWPLPSGWHGELRRFSIPSFSQRSLTTCPSTFSTWSLTAIFGLPWRWIHESSRALWVASPHNTWRIGLPQQGSTSIGWWPMGESLYQTLWCFVTRKYMAAGALWKFSSFCSWYMFRNVSNIPQCMHAHRSKRNSERQRRWF